MKKITTLLIMLMMLISITSLAIADEAGEEQETTDSETEKEIEVMNNSLGAEIRLLQLQKALLKNIFKGNMTIEVLTVLGFNTTALEEILDQMKEILEEVKTANTSSNESVQIFVELKNQSKNLTTQFRETLKDMLDEITLKELRQMIKENFSEEFQDLSKNIRNKIRHFNRNQLYRLYGLIGDANDSFIEEYMNGNVTLNLSKIQLCKAINQLTAEKRYFIFSEIKQENIKRKINAEVFLEEMQNNGKGKGKGKWG
jgi:hypothetical protein